MNSKIFIINVFWILLFSTQLLNFQHPIPYSGEAIIFLAASVSIINFFLFSQAEIINNWKCYCPAGSTKILKYCMLLSLITLIIDFLLIGVSFSNSMAENREIYETSRSPFAYILYISLGFSVYYIIFTNVKVCPTTLFFIFCVAIIFALSGNRQTITIFFCIFLFKSVLIGGHPISIAKICYLCLIALSISTVFFTIQIIRQSYVSTTHVDFLYQISGIQCKLIICNNDTVNFLLTYFYQYFGAQLRGFSMVFSEEITSPMFSSTFPIFYRQIFSVVFPADVGELSYYTDFVISHYDIYPRFWGTGFSNFIMDFGFNVSFGLISFLFILGCLSFFHKIVFSITFSRILIVNLFFIIVMGWMFFPLREAILFLGVLVFPVFFWGLGRFNNRLM